MSIDKKTNQEKILIILTGSTYADLRKNLGDFDNWIKQRCYDTWNNWDTAKIENVAPDYIENYSGIIFTGAHNSLTKEYPYLSRAEHILDKIVDKEIPTFGICFGHQLINKLFGGKIVRSPMGMEIGVIDIQLTLEGMADSWFINSNTGKIKVYSCHDDIVIDPGIEFIQLAWNSKSIYQATGYKDFIRTVQFHPEFYKPILTYYIRKNLDTLRKQHSEPLHKVKPISKVIDNKRELPMSDDALINFVKFVRKKSDNMQSD
ncbi:MAG: type 1 glutamine amidotransferase [Candidatus Marinimicrobia bacterium]|nr:type 1 glutamine amidotransferase [Candidatus Neomarinimicrobiota bacterium]